MMRLIPLTLLGAALGCAPSTDPLPLQAGARPVSTSEDPGTCVNALSGGQGTCRPPPNVMLLVDKSGSMLMEAGSGTRLSELKQAMGTFLAQAGDTARLGLAVFPASSDGATCTSACVPGEVVLPVVDSNQEADLLAAAADIDTVIQALGTPGGLPVVGGTPTAATLTALGNVSGLQDPARDDFILLLTDGLPNCNDSLDANTCACATGSSCAGIPCNCLDTSVVGVIQGLAAQGIRTLVVGFGADAYTSVAADILSQMAAAGGMPLSCPDGTDEECGVNNACDPATGQCARNFYLAGDAVQLAAALPHACHRAATASAAP